MTTAFYERLMQPTATDATPTATLKCPYEICFETYFSNGIQHDLSFPTNVCKLQLYGYDFRALHYRSLTKRRVTALYSNLTL